MTATAAPGAIPVSGLALSIVGLRAAALALSLAGQSKAGETLYLLADLADAGRNIDDHMAAVTEKLKARQLSIGDWEDVYQRINADRARLHAETKPAT